MLSGEIRNNSIISVFVPDGWKAFDGINEGNTDYKKVHIYKNAENEFDILKKAGITICYYGQDQAFFSTRMFYDNTEDIVPFTLGEYTWNGFTCTSCGYPYTILEAFFENGTFQVMILHQNEGNTISLNDEDVQKIIESITV